MWVQLSTIDITKNIISNGLWGHLHFSIGQLNCVNKHQKIRYTAKLTENTIY